MEKNTNDEIEIDLIDLFHMLRTRLWSIILSAVLLASAAGLISVYLITPIYKSTTKLFILTKTTTYFSLEDIQMGTQLTRDYMVLVKSRPVVELVRENLGLDMSYEQLCGMISLTNPTDTRILEITAEYTDANMAKKIVDEFAKVSVERIAKIMDTEEPTIVEEGYVSGNPTSPNIKKNIIIGSLIGIFIAVCINVVLHLMNDNIKTSKDVEKYLDINTFGQIPIETKKGS